MIIRTVEVQSGKIEIDGVEIQGLGLETLRNRLALVPQDSTLFLGTLRENLYVISGLRSLSVRLRYNLQGPPGHEDGCRADFCFAKGLAITSRR